MQDFIHYLLKDPVGEDCYPFSQHSDDDDDDDDDIAMIPVVEKDGGLGGLSKFRCAPSERYNTYQVLLVDRAPTHHLARSVYSLSGSSKEEKQIRRWSCGNEGCGGSFSKFAAPKMPSNRRVGIRGNNRLERQRSLDSLVDDSPSVAPTMPRRRRSREQLHRGP